MYEQVTMLLHEGRYSQIRNELTQMNVVDIAYLLEELDNEQALIIFRILPKEIAVEVFTYFSFEHQQYIIESVTDREIRNIVENLFMDDTVDILEEMPANVVKKIIKNTNEDKRKLINQFLNYPENSAGSIMTIEFVDLKKEMTVKEALDHIKETGVDKATIDICYVIDRNRKLEGTLPLRKLLLSEEDVLVGDVMETNVVSVNTNDDQEDIAGKFRKYDLIAMPVVDNENRLVGIITIDDIIDTIEQENTEDFQKMAAMVPSDEEYLKTGVFSLAKRRIAWLMVLMLSATFTASVMKRYEDVLSTIVVLVHFIPMLMDTAGNAGSQSATLIIRGLALDEIRLDDILKVFWKELRVSIVVGLALAVVNFLRLYIVEGNGVSVALAVSLSLLLTVVIAKIIGGVLPIMAKKLKMDPAIMAGPLITTIVDVLALMAYFSIAVRLLRL